MLLLICSERISHLKWDAHTAPLAIYSLLIQNYSFLGCLRLLRGKKSGWLFAINYLKLRGVRDYLVIAYAPLLLVLSLLYGRV